MLIRKEKQNKMTSHNRVHECARAEAYWSDEFGHITIWPIN